MAITEFTIYYLFVKRERSQPIQLFENPLQSSNIE